METFDDQKWVFEIELEKDDAGLGLTVAGYICEKGIIFGMKCLKFKIQPITITESLCGIFVKKVVDGSVADRQGKILPNDQVIEVSGERWASQEIVAALRENNFSNIFQLFDRHWLLIVFAL